jgi:hypothetical protein
VLLRVGLCLLAAGLLWLGGRWLVRALSSDEARITRAIEDACAGFGDARMDPVLSALAPDFRDETSGFDRADLHAALASAFFQEKDPATRAFPYRAEVDPATLTIQVQRGAPDTAEVGLVATIVDVRGGGRREAWRFRLAGRMEERDQGWCFVRAEHRTLAGSLRLTPR